MAISGSVQFIGIEKVLTAYQMREVPCWAIFHNRQFLAKYEGIDLNEGLQLLNDHLVLMDGSSAVYTLKIYEGENLKIKEKTECDGSFNFKLMESGNSQIGNTGDYELKMLIKEQSKDINELKGRLEQMEKTDNEDTDRKIGWIDHVHTIMEIPGMSGLVQGIIGNLFGKKNMGQIAGPVSEDSNEELDRLINAYMVLKVAMPDTLLLLEKLSKMANETPDKFAKFKSSIGLFL